MEEDFTIAHVIDIMKKTKKTDPLFKPLKKLKTALEVQPIIYAEHLNRKCVL